MHPWFKGCAETSAGNAFLRLTILPINTISRAGIKGDFPGLVSHRHNVFVVHQVTCCGVAAEVNLENKNTHLSTLRRTTFPHPVIDECYLKKKHELKQASPE